MKIKFLGTGAAQTKRRPTSFVINDRVLFDVGHGIVSALIENGLDTVNIDVIVISHFHLDHAGDLPFFLYRRGEISGDKALTLIGPKGLTDFLRKFYDVVLFDNPNGPDEKMKWFYLDNIKIIELGDGENYKETNFELNTFDVAHGGSKSCKGYIMKIDGEVIGCTGDTYLCDNLTKNLPNADTWIIDCAHEITRPNKRHLGLDEVRKIAEQYPNKKFYCVHRKDWTPPDDLKNIFFPMDGETIKV